MTERDKAKKEAIISFRKGSTKEERAEAFTNYLKKYVQPATTEKARTINPYSQKSVEELVPLLNGEVVREFS